MGFLRNILSKVGGGLKKAINWVKDKASPTISKYWNKISPFAKPLINKIPFLGPHIHEGIEYGEKYGEPVIDIIHGIANGRYIPTNENLNRAHNGYNGYRSTYKSKPITNIDEARNIAPSPPTT
jgi:hypothetical protein